MKTFLIVSLLLLAALLLLLCTYKPARRSAAPPQTIVTTNGDTVFLGATKANGTNLPPGTMTSTTTIVTIFSPATNEPEK